jgi:hypothetical protein
VPRNDEYVRTKNARREAGHVETLKVRAA